jgi:hypothetical protein
MIWIFFDFEDPEQQKLHDGKHVIFEKSSPGSYFSMIPSFQVFFSTGDRYMTVTRPLRLNSTQALGILGLWGSVNR